MLHRALSARVLVSGSAVGLSLLVGVLGASAEPTVNFGYGWPPPEPSACKPTVRDAEVGQRLSELAAEAFRNKDFHRAFELSRDAYVADCRTVANLANVAKALAGEGHYAAALDAAKLFRARQTLTGADAAAFERFVSRLEAQAAAAAASAPAATSSSVSTAPPAASVPPPVASSPRSPSPSPLPPPPFEPTPRASTKPAWIMMGAGVAAMVTGGVVAAVWTAQASDLVYWRNATWNDVGCVGPSCASELDSANSKVSRAQGFATAGWITLGVGGVATAAGLLWYLAVPKHTPEREATRPSVRLSIMGTGLGLTGAF